MIDMPDATYIYFWLSFSILSLNFLTFAFCCGKVSVVFIGNVYFSLDNFTSNSRAERGAGEAPQVQAILCLSSKPFH